MSSVIVILQTPNLEIEPGGVASCVVSVHNTGTIVEQFDITTVGDANEWATVTPPSLSLFPNTQQEVTVSFTPPREWWVEPGAIAFGVKATPANDPEGSVVEEGSLEIAAFQRISAELLPQVGMGRRKGKLGIAIDSAGNIPVPVVIRGQDPSDTLALHVRPRDLVLQPGTANFARLRIVPRHRYLRGPQRQSRFKVRIEPDGGEPILLDATMIQQALLPKGSFAGLAVIAALAAWFLVIRPTVKNTAVSAIAPQIQSSQKQTSKVAEQVAANNKKVSAVQKQVKQSSNAVSAATSTTTAKSSSGTTTTTATTTTAPAAATTTTAASSSTSTSTSTTTTTVPGAAAGSLPPGPYSNAIEVAAAQGASQQQTFTIPTGNEFDLTDLIMSSVTEVNGSTVQVGESLPGQSTVNNFFEMNLNQVDADDFSLKTPLVLGAGYNFVVTVNCSASAASACAASVYYDGTIQLKS